MSRKFNEMLIYLRKKVGLTQAELAKKIGVSRSTIGNYEKGIREPDFETLEKIADFFNVEFGYLMGKSGSEKDFYEKYLKTVMAIEKEKEIIQLFHKLNTDGQQKALAYLEDLASLPKYTEPSAKASEVNSAS